MERASFWSPGVLVLAIPTAGSARDSCLKCLYSHECCEEYILPCSECASGLQCCPVIFSSMPVKTVQASASGWDGPTLFPHITTHCMYWNYSCEDDACIIQSPGVTRNCATCGDPGGDPDCGPDPG